MHSMVYIDYSKVTLQFTGLIRSLLMEPLHSKIIWTKFFFQQLDELP